MPAHKRTRKPLLARILPAALALTAVIQPLMVSQPSYAYENPGYDQGVARMSRHDYDGAIESLSSAIGLGFAEPRGFFKRGQCFYYMNNLDRACQDFDEAITRAPNDSNYYLWRGKAYSKLGKDDLAIADFEKAIRLDPKLIEAFRKGGNGEPAVDNNEPQREGGGQQRRRRQRRQQDDGPGTPDTGNFGNLQARRRQPQLERKPDEKAIRNYREAMRLVTTQATAYFRPGTVFSSIISPEKLAASRHRAQEPQAKVASPDVEMKASFFKLDDPERIIKQQVDALTQSPDNASSYFERARAYQQLGKSDRALKDFNQAIYLDPRNAQYLLARAFLYHQQGRRELATEDIKAAQGLDPTLPSEIKFKEAGAGAGDSKQAGNL